MHVLKISNADNFCSTYRQIQNHNLFPNLFSASLFLLNFYFYLIFSNQRMYSGIHNVICSRCIRTAQVQTTWRKLFQKKTFRQNSYELTVPTDASKFVLDNTGWSEGFIGFTIMIIRLFIIFLSTLFGAVNLTYMFCLATPLIRNWK